MQLICPECKNTVDMTPYPNVAKDHVIECQMCGITLLVTDVVGEDVQVEIMDEGK